MIGRTVGVGEENLRFLTRAVSLPELVTHGRRCTRRGRPPLFSSLTPCPWTRVLNNRLRFFGFAPACRAAPRSPFCTPDKGISPRVGRNPGGKPLSRRRSIGAIRASTYEPFFFFFFFLARLRSGSSVSPRSPIEATPIRRADLAAHASRRRMRSASAAARSRFEPPLLLQTADRLGFPRPMSGRRALSLRTSKGCLVPVRVARWTPSDTVHRRRRISGSRRAVSSTTTSNRLGSVT